MSQTKIIKHNNQYETKIVSKFGQEISQINTKDGKLNGRTYVYYSNGQRKHILNFKDGKLSGKSYTWNEYGNITRISTYRNGLKHGCTAHYGIDWTYFSYSEEICVIHNLYKDGILRKSSGINEKGVPIYEEFIPNSNEVNFDDEDFETESDDDEQEFDAEIKDQYSQPDYYTDFNNCLIM
jgi:antitoxin component YwqK of YwqJK toxin-antitoxin module